MRLTLTPTVDKTYSTVSVETSRDDLSSEELVWLFRRVMLAAGYAEATVEEHLGRE